MSKFIKGQIPHNVGLRNEAKLRGDAHYFTGKPCKYGHIDKRAVINGGCLSCGKEKMAKFRLTIDEKKKAEIDKKARIRTAEWRSENPNHEGIKISKKEYKKRNPGKVRSDTVKRRTLKAKRTPSWMSKDDLWMIEQAYELAAIRTKIFGFSWHVDHVIPLTGKTVSGLHVPNNLQVIPWIDNVKKSNKFNELYLAMAGRK